MSFLFFVVLSGCDGGVEEIGLCVSELPPDDCSPVYEPIFDEVFSKTLVSKCAVSGGSCHAAGGAKGGLVLDDFHTAYSMLVDPLFGTPRVKPGDPACSLLVERLLAEDPGHVMPPGNPLSAAEKCAIVQWIQNGALP